MKYDRHFRLGVSLLGLMLVAIVGTPEVRVLTVMVAIVLISAWVFRAVLRRKEEREKALIDGIERGLPEVWPLQTVAILMKSYDLELRIRRGKKWTVTYISKDKVVRIEGTGSSSSLTRAIERANADLQRRMK